MPHLYLITNRVKIFTQLRRTKVERVEVTTLTINQNSYSLISFLVRVLILCLLLLSSISSFSFLFSSLQFCLLLFSSRKKIWKSAKTEEKYKLSIISSPTSAPDFFNPCSIWSSSGSEPWTFKNVHQTCKFWSSWYTSLWLDKGYSKFQLVASESSVCSNTRT